MKNHSIFWTQMNEWISGCPVCLCCCQAASVCFHTHKLLLRRESKGWQFKQLNPGLYCITRAAPTNTDTHTHRTPLTSCRTTMQTWLTYYTHANTHTHMQKILTYTLEKWATSHANDCGDSTLLTQTHTHQICTGSWKGPLVRRAIMRPTGNQRELRTH